MSEIPPFPPDLESGPIVVVGAGPAGSVCARHLAVSGREVVLLDGGVGRSRGFGETCGPRVERLLEQGGIPLPTALRAPMPTFASAWGSEQLETRSLRFWQAGDGLMLDRSTFDAWLLASAEDAGVRVLRGHRLVSGGTTSDGWTLRVGDGEHELTIAAAVVVEATGRTAASVLQPDATRIFDDDLVCVSLTLPEGAAGDPVALVESCAVGWWFALRAIDGRRLVAFFTDADFVGPAATRREWLAGLLSETRHVRHLAPGLTEHARVDVWDARTAARRVMWRDTWMSIGDAAWSLDPLSGAGVERAVADGVAAAVAIDRALLDADAEPLRAHALARARAFTESLREQQQFYALETRWSDAPFWARRQL